MKFQTEEEEELKRRSDDCNVAVALPSACEVDIQDEEKDDEEDEDEEVKRIRARMRMIYHLTKSGLDDDEYVDDGGGASVVCWRETATAAADDNCDRFWDDEMDGMLNLRRANPILDDDKHYEVGDWSTTMDSRPSNSLSKWGGCVVEVPISWSSRLVEGECGFEIRYS